MKLNFSIYSKGVVTVLILGLIAHFTAPFIPGMNGVLFGLIIGLIIGNLLNIPPTLNPGINFTSSSVLEFAIVLLAFDINLSQIGKMGWETLSIISGTIVLLLLATKYMSKKVNCPGSTGWLVGFGTAICGSSAIAAVAPSITKNKEDIGVALAVVNLMGGVGMILLPFVIPFFNLSDNTIGIVIGGSLHSVGNVTGAGYAISDEVGGIALTVKMIRIALLAPAVIFFSFIINRKEAKNFADYFKLPLYLWAFIAITLIGSYVTIDESILALIKFVAIITLTMAMTAIGMKISFSNLYASGRKAVGFGFMIFAIQLIILALLLVILS